VSLVKTLSWRLGCLIGAMWMSLMLLGNPGGTSVLGHIRELHPSIYALNRLFWVGALGSILLAGIIALYRIGSIQGALKVGVFAGLISGAIVFATLLGMTLLFHNAMMLDPSNMHEFALNAHRAPTEAELSRFLYTDALGGALNMMWICPLLGITLGGLGAVAGKLMRLSDPAPQPAVSA
jgi:hypothetical protein